MKGLAVISTNGSLRFKLQSTNLTRSCLASDKLVGGLCVSKYVAGSMTLSPFEDRFDCGDMFMNTSQGIQREKKWRKHKNRSLSIFISSIFLIIKDKIRNSGEHRAQLHH